MLEHEPAWNSMLRPHQWPGIDNWLLGFGHLVDPGAASRLTAEARTAIAERAAADPRVAHALAPVIVRLAADKAKGVRQQAVAALRVLTPQTQAAVLPPVLATLPSAQSAELVEYLAGTDEGAALLESAVADGARFGTAVQKAKARREALQSADQGEQSLIVPPFIPLADQLDEGRTLAELRRLVDARISRDEGSEHPWAQRRLKGLRSLTDGDLMDAIRVAEGIVAPHPTKLAEGFAVHLLAGARTGFNPVHLLRLDVGKVGSQHRYGWAISACVDQITDLRQVEDAFRRTGQSSEAFEQVPVMARVSAWSHLEPEVTWPWFAHRQDVLQACWPATPTTSPTRSRCWRRFHRCRSRWNPRSPPSRWVTRAGRVRWPRRCWLGTARPAIWPSRAWPTARARCVRRPRPGWHPSVTPTVWRRCGRPLRRRAAKCRGPRC